MKKILQTILLILAFYELHGQTFQWCDRFGGSVFSETQITGSATDLAGNLYFTGMFSGTVDFDPSASVQSLTALGSAYDAFVVKMSSSGQLIFAERFGGSGSNTMGAQIAIDNSGNIYFSGTSSNTADFDPGAGVSNLVSMSFADPFICKLTSTGILSWVKNIKTPDFDVAGGITFDLLGRPIFAGAFGNVSIDFDPGAGVDLKSSSGGTDGFILFLDQSGNYIKSIIIGGTGSESISSIQCDATGNIYYCGYFGTTCDMDPGPGVVNVTSNGQLDVFISKLTPSGIFSWSKALGGSLTESAMSLQIGSSGNIYVSGAFNGTVDFDPSVATNNLSTAGIDDGFILKLSNTGSFIWADKIGGTGVDRCYDIILDNNENIYCTGIFQDIADLNPGLATANYPSAGVYDVFVLKLNSAGQYQWSYAVGSTGYDQGYTITLNSSCNLYIAGAFQLTVDFNPGIGTSTMTATSSSADAFIQSMNNIGGSCTTTLPVELLSFSGNLVADRVDLYWETASEINNDYFTVLRSEDGKSFFPVSRVEGHGTSTIVNSYTYSDIDPLIKNSYYKLLQSDFDGTTSESDVILIRKNLKKLIQIISATDITRIIISDPEASAIFIRIFDLTGKCISENYIRTDLPLNNLPEGTYFITAASGEKSQTEKVFIPK